MMMIVLLRQQINSQKSMFSKAVSQREKATHIYLYNFNWVLQYQNYDHSMLTICQVQTQDQKRGHDLKNMGNNIAYLHLGWISLYIIVWTNGVTMILVY